MEKVSALHSSSSSTEKKQKKHNNNKKKKNREERRFGEDDDDESNSSPREAQWEVYIWLWGYGLGLGEGFGGRIFSCMDKIIKTNGGSDNMLLAPESELIMTAAVSLQKLCSCSSY